nr:hypothetical protein 149p1_00094 [Serratia proteamaculans]
MTLLNWTNNLGAHNTDYVKFNIELRTGMAFLAITHLTSNPYRSFHQYLCMWFNITSLNHQSACPDENASAIDRHSLLRLTTRSTIAMYNEQHRHRHYADNFGMSATLYLRQLQLT